MQVIILRQTLATFLSSVVLIRALTPGATALSPGGIPQQQQRGEDQQSVKMTPQQIDNLVAPIALYPDALVAQILSGSTYPTEIVEADRFAQENKNLSQRDPMNKVNGQNWDPASRL